MASRRVAEALHLKEADLVEAAGEDVDDVAVVSSPLREVVIELSRSQPPRLYCRTN